MTAQDTYEAYVTNNFVHPAPDAFVAWHSKNNYIFRLRQRNQWSKETFMTRKQCIFAVTATLFWREEKAFVFGRLYL